MKNLLLVSVLAFFITQTTFAGTPQAAKDPKVATLGATTAPLDDNAITSHKCKIRNGVVITNVDPNSIASGIGLKKDDVIHNVNGQDIINTQQLASIFNTFKEGDRLVVTITRNGKTINLRGMVHKTA